MGFYTVIHDNKSFDDIVLLQFVICQCSNNTWKCERWFMKDLVQKFKILVFIDHLLCLFNYIIDVCSCRKVFSYTIQIHDHLRIGLTLKKFIWNNNNDNNNSNNNDNNNNYRVGNNFLSSALLPSPPFEFFNSPSVPNVDDFLNNNIDNFNFPPHPSPSSLIMQPIQQFY